jgi:hypothetical protein
MQTSRVGAEAPATPAALISQISSLLTAHEERFQRVLDRFMEQQAQALKSYNSSAAPVPRHYFLANDGQTQQSIRASQKFAELEKVPMPAIPCHNEHKQVKFCPTSEIEVVSVSQSAESSGLSEKIEGSKEKMFGTEGRMFGTESSLNPWWRESRAPNAFAKTGLTAFMQSQGWLKSKAVNELRKPIGKAAMQEILSRRNCVQTAIMSSYFDAFCAVMILTNAAMLGYQVEYMSSSDTNDIPGWINVIQVMCAIWFILEFSLRLWASGLRIFLREWEWNSRIELLIGQELV